MKYLILIILFSTIFVSCKKDRAVWDPTPELYSVKVIKTACEPYDVINYTKPGENTSCPDYPTNIFKEEIWAELLIKGANFSDAYGNIDEVRGIINGKDLNCKINYVTSGEINCTLAYWNYFDAGAGIYYMKAKTMNSDWSNSVPVTVY
jgi:hypothetical protein